MRRKFIAGAVIISCSLVFSACSANTETEEGGQKNLTGDPVIDLSEIQDFSGELDFDYVPETDAQPDGRGVYTSDGKYFLDSGESGGRLQFYDEATGQTVLVCSKSNCLHDDNNCDAFFDRNEYPSPNMWYYKGNLYMESVDGDYLCINRISLDGTTREKSCTLMRMNIQTTVEEDGSESIRTYYPEIQLHRGYAYFSTYYPGCKTASLCRVKLDSEEEAQTICTLEENYPDIYRISPYGRYVFFQMGSFEDEELTSCSIDIYVYDTEGNEKIMRICEDAIREYTVVENSLYYFDAENNIFQKDLGTGKSVLFYKSEKDVSDYEITMFGHEGDLIYQRLIYVFCEETNEYTESVEQIVLDKNGNVTDTLRTEDDNLLSPYGR